MGEELSKDPYNIIVTGAGGQGNVTASRVLGTMLIRTYIVTIGETFGASQRGGSVMSHVRVSAESVWSPQILQGEADLIVALEPVEALRVLGMYGNTDSRIIVNTRPIYPVGVITGELEYPSLKEIRKTILEFTEHAWFLNATDVALERLGNPILGNMIVLGAVAGLDLLPVDRKDFEYAVSRIFPEHKIPPNIEAFDIGIRLLKE